MLMPLLASRVALEQPRIDAALGEAVNALPPAVRPVADYILRAGGKRLRPMLTVLMAGLLGYRQADIYPLAATMELLHTATLLHDDVLDHADSRRGQPAAHHKFGSTVAILGGDAMLARASRIIAGYNDPRLTECAGEMLERTAAGQILELSWQGQVSDSMDIYFDVITGKTAWMLRTACVMAILLAGGTPEQLELGATYGLNMGIAFQMVDDALDFAPSSHTGKPEGGDIREAKLTPPLYLYAASLPVDERERFATRFAARAFTDEQVQAIVHHIRAKGHDTATRRMADTYLDRARTALDSLIPLVPASQESSLLRQVIGHVGNRDK